MPRNLGQPLLKRDPALTLGSESDRGLRELLLRGGKLLLQGGDALALTLREPALTQRGGRWIGGSGGWHGVSNA
jgi:hypothetical protein